MVISKEEFLDWKTNVVTRELHSLIQTRIREGEQYLGAVAGKDPAQDRFVVGLISGLKEILDADIQGESKDD